MVCDEPLVGQLQILYIHTRQLEWILLSQELESKIVKVYYCGDLLVEKLQVLYVHTR